MNRIFLLLSFVLLWCFPTKGYSSIQVFDMAQYGVLPDEEGTVNASPLVSAALQDIIGKLKKERGKAVVLFRPGVYHFFPNGSAEREYYISNHDQDNPKRIGLCIEDAKNLTVDGQGATFVFHGQMLPIALIRSVRCALRNITIDFQTPHIAQVEIIANSKEKGIIFKPSQEVKVQISKDSLFSHSGEGWRYTPSWGVAFEKGNKHLLYNTGDIGFNLKSVYHTEQGCYVAPHWKDKRLHEGCRVAMRTGHRPTPGIFLYKNKETKLSHVAVCYAEGMGLLAQLCEDIVLDHFSTPISTRFSERCFTTQADATHFSGCKGEIVSNNGFYTGMMDDAINVHGTYLQVTRHIDDKTLEARYMHSQSWGFKWGEKGDRVQFIRAKAMETMGKTFRIKRIECVDKEEDKGVKTFRITLNRPFPNEMAETQKIGIENLTWTPKVTFCHNTISNNRARGALFSTPRSVRVEDNTFDHVSGCAILLCGDCNGWYETGACRNVTIRGNRFINVLTSLYQFTNAIISIYPEIPDLKNQQQYFHGGKKNAIRIENNHFEIFDIPIVYAQSVNGLTFRHNTLHCNKEYLPFHWNKTPFKLIHVKNAVIQP